MAFGRKDILFYSEYTLMYQYIFSFCYLKEVMGFFCLFCCQFFSVIYRSVEEPFDFCQ